VFVFGFGTRSKDWLVLARCSKVELELNQSRFTQRQHTVSDDDMIEDSVPHNLTGTHELPGNFYIFSTRYRIIKALLAALSMKTLLHTLHTSHIQRIGNLNL
jgi:hypothetical protein